MGRNAALGHAAARGARRRVAGGHRRTRRAPLRQSISSVAAVSPAWLGGLYHVLCANLHAGGAGARGRGVGGNGSCWTARLSFLPEKHMKQNFTRFVLFSGVAGGLAELV